MDERGSHAGCSKSALCMKMEEKKTEAEPLLLITVLSAHEFCLGV